MNRSIFYIFSLLILFSSCKVGQNYKGVEVEVPDEFRVKNPAFSNIDITVNTDTLFTDSLIDISWFSIFNDPVLDSLVKSALENNQDLKIAAENITQAQFNLIIQRSNLLPYFGYEANITRGNFLNGNIGSTQNFAYGTGFMNWELDFWGKYRRLNEAAKAQILASEYGYRSIQISLLATLADAYFQLLELRKRLEISEQTLTLRDSMLYIIEARFDRGIIPGIDLNQAQIQRAIAASTIPVFEREIIKTENLISVLTGTNPKSIPTGIDIYKQDTSIIIPEVLPIELLTRRPDIMVAEQEVIIQNALVGVAQANRLPSLSLNGAIGYAMTDPLSFSNGTMIWSIGGSILGPLFNWNRLKRIADSEKSKREQSLYSYERTLLNAFRDVEDVTIEISTLEKELIARRQHVEAAASAQMLSQNRYDQGQTSYLEYLESQRQYFESQQNLAGTLRQLLSAYASLYKALGGGWDINE
ncbi:efflux transporter outer membrane subunit [Mangrovivirga sp. M17]|uniref:Efflux transporter outer membrane subunit n=1 Tax=Mangrovivirga halotolerans TaxID=2993936 RepID=A0ABT3RN50_9BACT|nr:efflux transporter outer membrane subunit [Mangrovivirga halotolerans]MCX2743026.1 efflux transporter outer membrane subunit [Mangrovivirga halotolerans]